MRIPSVGFYAYFLDKRKNTVIADLFLGSLLQIVGRKSDKELEFGNHFCQLELQTTNGKRIDMLIKTGNETFDPDDYALVIENKIFSAVHNDLLEYWNTITIPAERKVGILLTLNPVPIPEQVKDVFINITHAEWMSEIRKVGLPHDLDANVYVYLNDFIRNMSSIVDSTESMSEDARFFFDHTSKILRAIRTQKAAWTHVDNQLKIFSEKIGLPLHGSNSDRWRNTRSEQSNVYYVIDFGKTLTEDPSISVILEVYRNGIAQHKELRQLLTDGGYYQRLKDNERSSQSWAQIAFLDYKLSKTEIEHLGTALYDKVIRDFDGAYQLVYRKLHEGN